MLLHLKHYINFMGKRLVRDRKERKIMGVDYKERQSQSTPNCLTTFFLQADNLRTVYLFFQSGTKFEDDGLHFLTEFPFWGGWFQKAV